MSAADMDDGGPAFPVALDHRGCVGAYGMSLRDWLAGQALVGLLASGIAEERGQTHRDVADIAYMNADAMLAARKAK